MAKKIILATKEMSLSVKNSEVRVSSGYGEENNVFFYHTNNYLK